MVLRAVNFFFLTLFYFERVKGYMVLGERAFKKKEKNANKTDISNS